MRIALAGSGQLAAGILNSLLDSAHTVVALIQNGRIYSRLDRFLTRRMPSPLIDPSCVIGLAREHGIPIYFINTMQPEELEPLARLDIELLLVAGFGIILKQPILELPKIGCVNCHSSLLPRHRGPNPFAAVVLAGESQSGVTFHVMTEKIDDGAIVAQYPFDLEERVTAANVYHKAANIAAIQVLEVLDTIETEGLAGTPQDPNLASYDNRPQGTDLLIRWDRPIVEIDRLVRALTPATPARFHHRGRTVYVQQIETFLLPDPRPPGLVLDTYPHVTIAAQDGAVQIIDAFYRGMGISPWPGWRTPVRPGDRLT